MKRLKKWFTVPLLAALVFTSVILPAGETLAYVLPDGNLSYGMSGDAVLSLQQTLQELGYLEATPDGIFGLYTKEALISFQQDRGIGADAIAGPVTLSVLYGITADEVRNHFNGSGSNTEGGAGGNTGSTGSGSFTLYKGKSGEDVKALQERLRELNYLTATPDGIFGRYTEAAVIAFQNANNLTADGIVGPLTWAALENAEPGSPADDDSGDTSSADTDTTDRPTGSVTTSRNLSKGMTGDDVKALQERLTQLGYLQVIPDGIFGNYTQAAVIAFQQKAGIGADGIVGPITTAALNNSQGTGSDDDTSTQDDNPGNTQSSSTGTDTPSRNLSRGMSGEDVKALQEKLKTLGYLTVAPDGSFGNYTYNAVIAFQKDHKIGQDGIVGPVTMAALDSSLSSGETVTQEPEKPAEPKVPEDVEASFTGFRTVGTETWYFIKGHVDTSKTCLVRTSFDGSSGWWYVKNGKVLTFINPPTLTGISNAPGGVEINWDVQEGVQAYRVYWLNDAGEWKFLADTTDNFYIDTDVESGNRYSYTVRAISKDGTVNLSEYDDNGISFTYTYQFDRYNASVTGTVTKKMVQKEAKAQGFDDNEITAIVSWVEGEAYHLLGEDYMAYLSACVLINGINDGLYGRGEDVLKKIATWGSYYTVAKQKARYKNASADALRATYLALKYPTAGIHYCRGANLKPSNCFYDSNLFIQGQDVYVW